MRMRRKEFPLGSLSCSRFWSVFLFTQGSDLFNISESEEEGGGWLLLIELILAMKLPVGV